MKPLTIAELIDHLSNTGAVIGLDAPVKAWLLVKPEELRPLDVAQVTGVLAGWDTAGKRPIATLKLTA